MLDHPLHHVGVCRTSRVTLSDSRYTIVTAQSGKGSGLTHVMPGSSLFHPGNSEARRSLWQPVGVRRSLSQAVVAVEYVPVLTVRLVHVLHTYNIT